MAAREPRALRLFVFLATALVVIGGSAGFLLWWTTYHPDVDGGASDGEEADLDSVVLRPVDFLPGTTADERDRITRLIDQAILFNPTPQTITPADDALVALGEVAAPRLVDAFHRVSQGEGFHAEANRRKALATDRILLRLQRSLPPAPSPHERRRADPTGRWIERRAKAWVVWWDAVEKRGPGGK